MPHKSAILATFCIIQSINALQSDPNGYVAYCPCMGEPLIDSISVIIRIFREIWKPSRPLLGLLGLRSRLEQNAHFASLD